MNISHASVNYMTENPLRRTYQILYLAILLGGKPSDVTLGLPHELEHFHGTESQEFVVADPLSDRHALVVVHRRILAARRQIWALAELRLLEVG